MNREAIVKHEAAHAVAAALQGWAVGAIELRADGGSCSTTPPNGRDDFRRMIEECVIRLAGAAAAGGKAGMDFRDDLDRVNELVDSIAAGDRAEADALKKWLVSRTRRILGRPHAQEIAGEIERQLLGRGRVDLQWTARADNGTPAPIINIQLPELPPATVNVEILPPADRQIAFERNAAGDIIAASSSSIPGEGS